ncbi:DUF6296 family protein [Streptomyces sp. C]|uniref:DUF6296 family protein n=1 Tax=Streptomyces sp. C TaxID=253839 RepID=UPI0001DEF657|nr:DUF6296 family protein [Streptomyces sp. C]EFL19117.1 conserved hypothetical protein [Streptomyces sp. C]
MSVRRYELTFPGADGTGQDTVVVERTELSGPGGHPVYADASGIVRAEISDRDEVRMLASGGQQALAHPTGARRLPDS